jgi:hypothetical protein
VVPRIGVAYDLFGNGRTAIKATAHKYVSQEATTLAMQANPLSSFTWSAKQEFRSWTDLDGNGSVVNKDGGIQYNEVGGSPDKNWGTAASAATIDVNDRPGQWEFNAQVQHELFRGISVSGGWYRRDYFRFYLEDNIAQSYGDYEVFNITAPTDTRLGTYSGSTIPIYNLNSAKFGIVDRVFRTSPLQDRRYDGFEFAVNGRVRNGFFGFSTTTERTFQNTCDQDNPNLNLYCDYPRAWQTQFKGHIAYPLWWGITASGFLQGYPGPDIQAFYNVTPAIAGRPLTGGQIAAAGTFNILPRETYFLPFQRKVDLRFTRRFKFGGNGTISPDIDIFNLFNANTAISVNQTVGPTFLTPLAIMQARYVRFGLQVDW